MSTIVACIQDSVSGNWLKKFLSEMNNWVKKYQFFVTKHYIIQKNPKYNTQQATPILYTNLTALRKNSLSEIAKVIYSRFGVY